MTRALLLSAWVVASSAVCAADEIEPLDGDFLEYLANMEDEADDWTLLEAAPPKADKKPATQQPTKSEQTKEAAKPAVQKR